MAVERGKLKRAIISDLDDTKGHLFVKTSFDASAHDVHRWLPFAGRFGSASLCSFFTG